MKYWWLILAAVLAAPRDAHAYGWMIRHDYAACSSCHADPSGGSTLTRYGRAQGETLLRTRYDLPAPSEASSQETALPEPGPVADFLFGAFKVPDELLLGGDVRALLLLNAPPGGPTTVRPIFPMQLDVTAQYQQQRLRANVSLGYGYGNTVIGASLTPGVPHHLLSRHHWVGVDLGEDNQWLLRFGRMNVPFGLRMIEHTSWVRQLTHSDVNVQQQYGFAVAYGGSLIRTEVMAVIGNLLQSPVKTRERGYTGYFELVAGERAALGVSSAITHTEADIVTQQALWRHAHGAFVRYAPHRMLVVAAEHDFIIYSQPMRRNDWGFVSWLQVDFEPPIRAGGIHLIGALELKNEAMSRQNTAFGVWGGLAWFLAPHAGFRFDTVYRSIPATDASPRFTESLSFLIQLNMYL